MDTSPLYVEIFFIVTTLLTVWLFYKATNKSKFAVLEIGSWLGVQAGLSIAGFYTITTTFPPRLILLVLPPIFVIGGLFTTKKGKNFIDSLDTSTLTLLHTIRIPVEIILFCLFKAKMVPQLMTVEGRNFDILSGITAPFIYYFGYKRKLLSKNILVIWNIVCLGLLFNIVINAILSVPFPFQQFAFDQPNIGVLFFPFVWLPCCIVPLVLFSHLVSIRQLLK